MVLPLEKGKVLHCMQSLAIPPQWLWYLLKVWRYLSPIWDVVVIHTFAAAPDWCSVPRLVFCVSRQGAPCTCRSCMVSPNFYQWISTYFHWGVFELMAQPLHRKISDLARNTGVVALRWALEEADYNLLCTLLLFVCTGSCNHMVHVLILAQWLVSVLNCIHKLQQLYYAQNHWIGLGRMQFHEHDHVFLSSLWIYHLIEWKAPPYW